MLDKVFNYLSNAQCWTSKQWARVIFPHPSQQAPFRHLFKHSKCPIEPLVSIVWTNRSIPLRTTFLAHTCHTWPRRAASIPRNKNPFLLWNQTETRRPSRPSFYKLFPGIVGFLEFSFFFCCKLNHIIIAPFDAVEAQIFRLRKQLSSRSSCFTLFFWDCFY